MQKLKTAARALQIFIPMPSQISHLGWVSKAQHGEELWQQLTARGEAGRRRAGTGGGGKPREESQTEARRRWLKGRRTAGAPGEPGGGGCWGGADIGPRFLPPSGAELGVQARSTPVGGGSAWESQGLHKPEKNQEKAVDTWSFI